MTVSTLVFLLALTAVFILVMALGAFWAIKSGQFEDLEGPAQRILMDEDDPMLPSNQTEQNEERRKSELQ
ncbi:cbb3-type cytochrome oxidase assembly protein CcoS [Sulfuriferula sp. AH1]|uniref:cbb3-type cytochrome oxidase assembly protein CcoS n=1 Tax=Sulfuriferula sp. AH1 TaxID=1985873 RepID=UPI000B3B5B7B|nr:cbb3-type cytochrome oxidase assembly protein CcoS [Sulfuriferula sp. AH1]ARU32591.1 cbb3-type cytochrome oxidase assembly protein CcoS [Sulfuriferula sp. AH1]